MMANPKQEAINILIHYFRTVFEKVGLKWDYDNEVELQGIVNDIVDAAVLESIEPGNK